MSSQQISRYEILEELGRGATGIVYKARDPLIDRIVAIKTVSIEEAGAESDAWRQRFYREARSAGGLAHPNIVTIHDVGESGDVAYIAMEFLGRQSLRAILDSGAVLPQDRIADIAAQIADGLAFAHGKGVVHRDIKPANIMELDSGVVKITDFGIARLPTGMRTVAGTVFGSPRYISPERVQGLEVDGRSDIFSLGAVLYEMLTGVPPFEGRDLSEILNQVLNVSPAAPSSHNSRIAPGFDRIVARALAKRPDDRYAHAAEMAADLRKLVNLPSQKPMPRLPRASEPRPSPTRRLVDPTLRLEATLPDDAPPARPSGPTIGAGTATLSRSPKALVYGASAALLVVLAGGGWSLFPTSPKNGQPSADEAAAMPVPAVPAAARNDMVLRAAPADAPSRAEPAVTPAKDPPAPAKPFSQLAFAVAPWGEIYVNGKKVGVSPPMTKLKLAPGKYTVEIHNTTFQPYRESVDLRSATNVKIKHKFQ